MPITSKISSFLPKKIKLKLQETYCANSIKAIHGIGSIKLKPNEVAATCIVKNGEYYLESFIDHHTKKGIKHIFLLDNGSTDKTISIAKKYDNVSVLESLVSVGKYQRILKKVLAKKTVSGGWCLDLDIDEYFDYPYSDTLKIDSFLDYLNSNRYTAVITQMLDMFSDEPLSHLTSERKEDVRTAYQYYDTSSIKKVPYYESEFTEKFGKKNVLPNCGHELFFGGIRDSLYGLHCLLTKHSLFSMQEKGTEIFSHVHFMNNSRIADVSCVLLHYKLTSNAFDIALQNKNAFIATSQGYAKFIELMESKSDYIIKQNTSIVLNNVNDLIPCNFLNVSDPFVNYAHKN